jgi:hypothetical protein
MDINRYKLAIVPLFMITICSWLLPLSTHAARGMVISDLSHKSGKLGAYRALIIGINDYKDPKIPDLKTAVNDAKAMAELLRKRYGFQVELLKDHKATKEAIYQAIRKLVSSTKPDDSVLIYYAGHGDLDRLTNEGWWIPADAKGGYPVTYLENSTVQTYIRSMKARHVLLISDSCFSGTLFGQLRVMPRVIDNKYYLDLYNEKSRWGITSGNRTPVADYGTDSHSVFAYQLLKELKKNEKPYISTQELYTQIAPIISNNSEQTPLCRPIRNTGDQGGEFVFVLSSVAMIDNTNDAVKVDASLVAKRKRLKHEPKDFEKIKTNNTKQKNDKKTELAYVPKVSYVERPDSRFKLAIFPWKLKFFPTVYDSFLSIQEAAEYALRKTISDNQKLFPLYSYYDLKNINVRKIDENILTKEVIDKLWIKTSYISEQKPNTNLISSLGKQLQVDAVLIYYLFANPDSSNSINVFLINVKNQKTYHAKDVFQAWPFQPTLSFQFVTNKVYADFEKDALK